MEYFKGYHFAFIIFGIMIISFSVSIILYLTSDPSFSIFTHWVSDLGEGPNYSNYVFNTFEILSGILLIFFFFCFSRFLEIINHKSFLNNVSFIIGTIAALGMIVAGAFPMYHEPVIHLFGAILFFVGVVLFCAIYGKSQRLIENSPNLYPITGYIVSLINLFFLFSYLIGLAKAVYLFLEWISIIAFFIWVFIEGVYLFKEKYEKK